MASPGSYFRQWLEEQARAAGGIGEVGLTIGSGMAADVVGGVNASLDALAGGQDPARHVQNAREAFTYAPRTAKGQEYLQDVGEGIEYVGGRLQELPGAQGAQEGWYDFSSKAPMAAAVVGSVAETFTPGGRGKRAAQSAKLAARDFAEVPADAFRASIDDARAKMSPQDRAQVSPLPENFTGRTFMSPDGKSGFGIDGTTGELIALYRHPDAPYSGVMDAALTRGRVEGATHLNAFDTYLAKGYAKRGAVERERAAWNDEYAPPGWDKATMGTPDYVTMDLVPSNLQKADIRQLTQAEPDIGRSLIAAAGGKKAAKAPPVTDTSVGEALRARERYRREPSTTPSPEAGDTEWQAFGDAHGVNLTVSPAVEVAPGVQVPGGLDGKFTIADLFEMKSLNIDPNKLPRPVHDALMQKIVRTYDIPNPDPVDVFNRLSFALLSPNAPLLPNEFLAQRLRATSMDDIRKLASREGEAGLAKALDEESGVGAASRGGLGAKGTADLSALSSLAKAVIEKPEMFRAQPGETMRDVALRVFNQIPGLGPKTASLGVPWLDLPNANVSAVDLHMVRNNYQRLLTDEKVGKHFVERMAKKLKTESKLEAVQAAIARNPDKAEQHAIDVIGGSDRSKVYRNKKSGEVNPEIPSSLSPDLLWREPKQAKFFNEFYDRVVDFVNESRGADPALALFPEQWRLWDGYRGRFEPHEFAHPDWRKLPKQSFNEMQKAFQANRKAGFARDQGFSGQPHDQSWKQLYYGRANPKLLAGLAGGGLLAGWGLSGTNEKAKENEKKRRNRTADLLEEMGE